MTDRDDLLAQVRHYEMRNNAHLSVPLDLVSDLAAEVRRLRAENEGQRDRIGRWSAEWSSRLVELEAERDALRAELDRARPVLDAAIAARFRGPNTPLEAAVRDYREQTPPPH